MLVSPFLYYFLFGHQYPPGATKFEADIFAFVVPPRLVALHSGPPGHGSNPETYLGLPLVVLLFAFAWGRRQERSTRLLGACLLAAVVASLGSQLVVRGDKTGIPLPWAVFHLLPVFRYAIPVRLALFVILPAAVIVAMWLAQPSRGAPPGARAARWALALAAIAFMLPAVGNTAWNLPVADPPFFQHHAYRAYLNGSDHVLTVPVWGPNQRWIANAGYPFALSAGYAGDPYPPATLAARRRTPLSWWGGWLLATGPLADPSRPAGHRDVVQQGSGPSTALFGRLGVRPIATGGVLFCR